MSKSVPRWARVSVMAVLVPLVVATFGVTGSSGKTTATPQAGGTLRVAILQDVLSFDPYSRALQQYTFTKVIYEPLIEYSASMAPKAALATKWSFNKGLTAIKLQLRPRVTFHSGAPFNAAAVVANFQRARNAATGQHMFFFTSVVKEAQAIGDLTVQIELNDRTPVPLVLDALQSLPMVDPGYFTRLSREASGTGPYRLESWTPGQTISLLPNKNWWGGNKAPYLDRIVLTRYSDPSAAIAALQSGAVDIVQDVDPARARSLANSGFGITQGAAGSLTLELRLNPRKAPFTNQTYRRALNYALDRKAIVKTIRAGFGKAAVTPWLTHDPAVETKLVNAYPFNLSKVAAAIKSAGIANPDFTIMLVALPDTIQVAQILQASLKTIGVEVKLETLDGATFVQKLVAGDFQATVTYGSGGQHYPSQLASGSAWRTSNNALWGNDVPQNYVRAIAFAQTALTKATQAKALAQLRNAALVMSSVLVLADRPTLFARSKKVQGFDVTVDSMPLYGSVWLSK